MYNGSQTEDRIYGRTISHRNSGVNLDNIGHDTQLRMECPGPDVPVIPVAGGVMGNMVQRGGQRKRNADDLARVLTSGAIRSPPSNMSHP